MRKQTTYLVEPGDTVYLINDNFDIRAVELTPDLLEEDLDKRSYISDKVVFIDERLVLKNFKIHDDQIDLLEVEPFHAQESLRERSDSSFFSYEYNPTDRKAFTTKEAAETYLTTKIDKHRIARMILKEINEDLDIHLTEIEKILKNLSDRLREFDIPENVLLNSNLCKISELCDLLDLDQADILHLSHE